MVKISFAREEVFRQLICRDRLANAGVTAVHSLSYSLGGNTAWSRPRQYDDVPQ